MTVTLQEFQDFIDVFKNQGIEELKEGQLRRAIRHHWNVGSQPTVDSRIQTLKEEGWIKKLKKGDRWKIIHDRDEGIGKLFQEPSSDEQ